MPKEVKLKGKLKQTSDGFVYLDVPDEVVLGLATAVGVKKPPYFTKKFNNVGAHISVMGKSDTADLKISELGKEFEYTIEGLEQLKPDDWEEMKQVYFITVESPALEKLRVKYGLPKKHHGHSYHITFGCTPTESIHKLSYLYTEEDVHGVGLRNSMNLGQKIAKAMQFGRANARKNQRTPKSKQGGLRGGNAGLAVSPPPPRKPRYRKYFGMTLASPGATTHQ